MKLLCKSISSSSLTKLTCISTHGIHGQTLPRAHCAASLLSHRHRKAIFLHWQCIHKCSNINNSHQNAGLQHHSIQHIAFESQPSSWLFVSDSVAGAYGAQVNLDLDLDGKLSGDSLNSLKANVKSRDIQQDIDKLVTDFKHLCVLKEKKADLIAEKEKIIKDIKLLKIEGKDDDKTKLALQTLGERLSQVKESVSNFAPHWDLQESVTLSALKLPNDLHHSTPLKESVITKESKCKKDPCRTVSHIDIAKKYDIIKFSSAGPKAYYLQRELVVAEMDLSNTICDYLQSKNYRHLAGPEFFKTPVIEACGQDVRDYKSVLTMLNTIKDVIEPMNHLAGVSPSTFAAYVAKTCIGDAALPLNLFACGRSYQNSNLPGLFGAAQITKANLFSCVKKENLDCHFDETVALVWDFLEALGFPVRLCEICARELRCEERRRTEVQMYSPGFGSFIPVAAVSDLGDFISRRLMVIHNKNHADIRSAKLVHMVSGTALNITALLAIWMEHSMKGETTFSLKALPSSHSQQM